MFQTIIVLVVLSTYFHDISRLTYWQLCIFGIGICIFQGISSILWTKFFQYGRLEWLSRKCVYKK
ncbi:DUF418 domain-containing protein (plasmid) [Bacillus mycoides]|nr:DUF418 domain-containing protein [Bacillus mycoides]